MASEKDIKKLQDKIIAEAKRPEFVQDLCDWARQKYSRGGSSSRLMNSVHSRNLYMKFLEYVYRSGWHKNGIQHIIKYLSHGEQAPLPIHIRLILDSDKQVSQKYIKGIKFSK